MPPNLGLSGGGVQCAYDTTAPTHAQTKLSGRPTICKLWVWLIVLLYPNTQEERRRRTVGRDGRLGLAVGGAFKCHGQPI